MKLKRDTGLFFLGLFAAFYSCRLDSNGETEIGIREDIVLHLSPTLSPSSQKLSFIFESLTPYNCNGAGFDYKNNVSSGNINIQLLKVDVPEPCTGGNASAKEELSMPEPMGTYELTIEIGEVIENTGKLIIDQKGYRLFLDKQDGIQVPFTAMHRIPQGVIWGYIYNIHQQQKALSDFNVLLAPYVSETDLEEGNYGRFYASAPHQISLPLPSNQSSASSFVLHFNGNPFSLGSIVESIKPQLPAGSELKVFSWNGFEF